MAAPLSPAHYSFSWALGVVEQLRRKYPRATEIFCETWVVTDRELAAALAKRDAIYPQCREVIHMLDNYLKRGWNGYNTLTDVTVEIAYLRRKGWDRLADRLAEKKLSR